MESDAESEPRNTENEPFDDDFCECEDCEARRYDSDASFDDKLPEAEELLPAPKYEKKLSLDVLATRRLRRPEILDTELMVSEGPQEGSFMHRLVKKISVETLEEILGWLHPIDLIYLSYTTKEFRDLLACRNTIWKTARSRLSVATPDCPPCTSEEQWALFLFTEQCTICTGSFAEYSAWALRLRMCIDCTSSDFCAANFVKRSGVDCDWTLLAQLVPFWEGSARFRLKYDVVKAARTIMGHKEDKDDKALQELYEERKKEVEIPNRLGKAGEEGGQMLASWELSKAMEKEYISYATAELIAEGYEIADINVSLSGYTSSGVAVWKIPEFRDLDSYEWRRIKPEVVKIVQANREKRLVEAQRRCEVELKAPARQIATRTKAEAGRPNSINATSVYRYRCALCSSSQRLFNLPGLKNHIGAKHGIKHHDVNSAHYIKMENRVGGSS